MSVLLLAGPVLHLMLMGAVVVVALAAFGVYRLVRRRGSSAPER